MKIKIYLLLALCLVAAPVGALAKVSVQELNPVYIYVGSVEDGGWNKALEQGRLLNDQNFPGVRSKVVENMPEGPEFLLQVEKIIKQHNSRLVFASSYGYGDFLSVLAAKFPEVTFVHIAGYNTAPNVASVFARAYQLRYLTGIVAAFASKSGKIGYVASHPIAEVIRGLNAFTLGVRQVNPNAQVYVTWLDSWSDSHKEEFYAHQLINMGCDVLTMHTDTTAVGQACERKNVAFIGYNTDTRQYAPRQFLVATVWHWEHIFARYYQKVLDGTFAPEYYYPGINSGVIDLSPYGPLVTEQAKALVAREKQRLSNGYEIFVGPLYDNKGQQRLAPGQEASLQQLQAMDWLIQGVESIIFNNGPK